MRSIPVLAFRLLRGSGRGGLFSAGLSALAIAVSVALLLLTLGVNEGFSERAERESWLNPKNAGDDATALQSVSTDFVRDSPIAVVDLASTGETGDAPTPPGMSGFPEPGEVWMSPALKNLSETLPDEELADRYGSVRVGVLGPEALTYPEQLVVVIGREAESPALEAARTSIDTIAPYSAAPTGISTFDGGSPSWEVLYGALSAFATALLVVPLVVLGAAAGRLTTTQRDRRLSAMRLFGATPGQVVAITTFETVLVGVIGTAIGAAAYFVSLPLASQVEATGGTWFVSDLRVETTTLLLVLATAPIVVGASALAGMRRLVISPLGVAKRQRARGARVWRLVLFIALLVGYAVVAPQVGISQAVPFAVAFGVLFLALSILGPFVVGLLGKILTIFARGPKMLLAGRRLVDDPRSAWRTVGGITLAGFVAGFLTIANPNDPSGLSEPRNEFTVVTSASKVGPLAREVRSSLREANVEAEVSVARASESGGDKTSRDIEIEVRGGDHKLDRARTALYGTSLQPPLSSAAYSWDSARQAGDISSASLLVLGVTLAVAAASAAITGVTGVLDRRKTYGLLRLAGTPLSALDGARLRETLVPLVILGGGSVLAGMFCARPIASAAAVTQDAQSFVGLGVLALLALVGVGLAELASGLTLRSATRDALIHRE